MALVPLAVLVFLAAIVAVEPAINEVRPHSNRPGRFLSLPVPQKCANREYPINCSTWCLVLGVRISTMTVHWWMYECVQYCNNQTAIMTIALYLYFRMKIVYLMTIETTCYTSDEFTVHYMRMSHYAHLASS